MRLRLGTRGSELARTQSTHVAHALRNLGHEVEVVTLRSEGDVTTGSLLSAGGLGLFAATLRRALLAGDVDLVVHSLKDLPTAAVDGLTLGAIPPREDPSDALCARDGHTLATLPAMARVGTGSPRRAAQVRARRPDVAVIEIRGNVGTRLARVHGDATTPGDLDAVVLSRAGLARLGRFDAITDTLDLLPAPGQGALAVECRADDAELLVALASLDDAPTRDAVTAERAVLAELGVGCAAPVGAHARVVDGHLELTASVLNAEGTRHVTASGRAALPCDADALGRAVAADLLARGAGDVTPLDAGRDSQLDDFHHEQALWAPGTEPALIGRRVLVARGDGPLAQGVRAAGAEVDAVSVTETRPLPFTLPGRADWLVVTSPTTARMLADAGHDPSALAERVAAIGPATAAALTAVGATADLVAPGRADADALLAALLDAAEGTTPSALLPCSALARPRLADGLASAGWRVDVVHPYTTATRAEASGVAPWSSYDAVVVTAGSVVRGVVELLGVPPEPVRVVALGEPSAEASTALGLTVDAVAATPDAAGLVAALSSALGTPRRAIADDFAALADDPERPAEQGDR